MQKKSLMILGFVITITLLAWLVMAVSPSDTLRVVSPTSGTNVLWLNGTLIFNATFMNGTLGLGSGLSETPLFNVTYLFNISGVWTSIANLTNGCEQIGTTGTFACALNVTNLTVAEGNYTLTVNITNGTDGGSGVNSIIANFSGNMSSSIVIDHTAPIVGTSNVSSPFATGANISSAANGNFTFNVSVGDAVLGVQAVLINMTNASSDMVFNGTLIQEGTTNRYITSVNTTRFADGYFNITILANDSLGNLNNSARFLRMIVDNTRPIVATGNVSAPFVAGGNLSGNYIFNVSVGDALAGVQSVIINMTNSTNDMVLNLTLVLEGTNRYITSINTSRFADGYYNITVRTNDTAGNRNDTTIIQRIIIDNTVPSTSLSCTPNPVIQSETITCACSATDTTAGLNTSFGTNGVSTTANPSTAQTGPSFSVSCTSQDRSGNQQTVSTTYSVASEGSGGSSSSSSGGGNSLSPPSSGSTTTPSTSSSTGSEDANDESGQSQGATSEEPASTPPTSKFGIGAILLIVVATIIIVIIVVMIKRKK